MVKVSPNDDCPCDSGNKYKKCCRPYHAGNQHPPTPEALVRARYSAYALGLVDFIMQTTDPQGPSHNANAVRWRASLEAYCLRTLFTGLEILEAEGDKVTYQADNLDLGRRHRVIEHCRFREVDGKWLYTDGDMEEVKEEENASSEETS